jgi:hypothetical protein
LIDTLFSSGFMVVSVKRVGSIPEISSAGVGLEDILKEVAKIDDDAFRTQVARLLEDAPDDEERVLVDRVNEIFNLTYRYVIRNLEKEIAKNPEALF